MSNVMNMVYNNYLTSYATKDVTRYDTHKKSELRSIYSSIVKLNKESPWYLPTTNKSTQAYAIDLKENARELHNTIASLGGLDESGLLNNKTAYSTDPEVATASYLGSGQPDDPVPSFAIEVESLASPQENLGKYLNNSRVNLDPDSYSFDVAIRDMNYEFQFAIGEKETNRDVQERLVRLINNADIGLKASLAESGDQTALHLSSESTEIASGKNTIFSVTDNRTSKTAGAVDYFGLDYISHQASNASFRINGEQRFASSNHFTVSKMFEVQLNGISPEGKASTIGLKTDVESLTDSVINLADGYNGFVKAVSSYLESQPKSRYLVQDVSNIAALYQNSLESMGLNVQEDGRLAVDKNLLMQTAAETEDINQTFNFLKGFTKQLLRKTSQVSINPMDYVEKTVVAYKNPGRNFVSPYAASAYSGMMFNGYC